MHGSHTLGWSPYMAAYPHHVVPSMMAQMPWMHPYYYPPPAGYPLDMTTPVPMPVPKLEKTSESSQESKPKCVSLCADWCNRNQASSPGFCEVRDDEVDSILSRSSNGSLSPPSSHSQSSLPWTEPLSRWLSTHRHRPYPTKREKQKLSEMSGRSIEEVNAWLSSARRALKQKYDEEQHQQEMTSSRITEITDACRRLPEIAERVGVLPIPVVQPLLPSPPLSESRRTPTTSVAPAPPLSSPSPMPSPHTDERTMPVLVPEVAHTERCTSSPDLLRPLVIDFNNQSGRKTANDVTNNCDVTNDMETSSTTSEPSCFMKHKKRMLQRFLKEETSQDSDVGSPEKRSRKEYNRLELSAVSALISMGSQDNIHIQR